MRHAVLVMALALALLVWFTRGGTARAACAPVPDSLGGLVEYACFGGDGPDDGVALKLTPDGLRYCRGATGPWLLAAWLMQQDEWRGTRSLRNVSLEIRGHCWAALFPGLAERANPIDIEYFQAWPWNLWK